MRIQGHCVVTLRYRMQNSSGQVLENIMDGPAITYLYGEGKILPALERQLFGMGIGETKHISLKKEEDQYHSLDDDFILELIVDDIRAASEAEIKHGIAKQDIATYACNDDCSCYGAG